MANLGVNPAFWSGKRVFLTGHTGFKGSWLALWLGRLGAAVTGYANGIPTSPSLYEGASVESDLRAMEGDVRDLDRLTAAMSDARPDIVVHMAAQSLVRRSYEAPVETFQTNVLGTINVFEAVRSVGRVRVVLNVTSDKCYFNHGGGRSYHESDALGGDDPYSASKACAELVTTAYRWSFFPSDGPGIASLRAGNVIGGGDWATDRLVPDTMRAALSGSPMDVRNPNHVRPWQHVLNPLAGYLQLAQRLWEDRSLGEPWNFGPADSDARTVRWLVTRATELWGSPIDVRLSDDTAGTPREASVLRLDSTRARTRLGWRPSWTLERGLSATIAWYRAFQAGDNMRRFTLDQITDYESGL